MTRANCPHCGRTIELSKPTGYQPARLVTSRRHGYRLQSSAAAIAGGQPPAGGDWQKITPVGRLEPKDITTSLYDAGISFGLVTIGALGVVWWQEWPVWMAPATGFTIGMWRYFGGIKLASGLLEVVETVTGADINGDGNVGDKPAPPPVVKVELRDDGGHWQFADLPGEPDSLQALAQAVTDGDSFAERTATNCGYTQEQWGSLRDVFIDRGWAKWNHPTRRQQGVSLLRGGRMVLKTIAATPLPGGSAVQNGPVGTQHHAARPDAHLNQGNYEFID